MGKLIAAKTLTNTTINTRGSKSISNRMLMIREVLKMDVELQNISSSEDTQLLLNALKLVHDSNSEIIDVHHAGTDMRFLTALLSVTDGKRVITGSERMKQRPIGELVNALKSLGAEITYLEKENYPPLQITGKSIEGGELEIESSVSSQFISALLLVASKFKSGLTLKLKGETVSMPYIEMTIRLLKRFGVDIEINNKIVTVKPLQVSSKAKENFLVESDWSSVSYWYSLVSLSDNLEIKLENLFENSLQADSVLPTIYKELGVETTFLNNKVILRKTALKAKEVKYDFTNCPDIAQTVAITCLGHKIKADFSGLRTLKVKETDRIVALKNEIEKFGLTCITTESTLSFDATIANFNNEISIATYNDHRMAMCFAPLCLKTTSIIIENEEVVNKSYPEFWKDLSKTGII
jgi:3-phosphoshikimate 1-carboxyvinyltransferase